MNNKTNYKIVVNHSDKTDTFYFGTRDEMMQKFNKSDYIGNVSCWDNNIQISSYSSKGD